MIFSVRKANYYDLDLTFIIKKNALSEYLDLLWGWNEEAQYEFHQEHFNPNNFQIIEVSNSPVGYLETHCFESFVFLCNLMISKEFQGKGIGKSVLDNLLKINPIVELEVLKVNFLAIRFYENSGFVISEEKEDVFRMKFQAKI